MLNQANISYSKISLKPQKMTDKTVVLISHLMVEAEGFEPPWACTQMVFKSHFIT